LEGNLAFTAEQATGIAEDFVNRNALGYGVRTLKTTPLLQVPHDGFSRLWPGDYGEWV
jgi:hypothetical protein